jgi:hypothetical protein
MSALALDFAYRYPFPSAAMPAPGGMGLRLATSGGAEEYPHFFKGRLMQPRRTAEFLRSIVEVVQSRFYIPPAMLARILALADPVVTSGDDILRFEAFSACCSTYARLDVLPQAVDGEWLSRGTTNVDFNAPFRAALARVRHSDDVGLAVGADAVELSRSADTVVERKVALPVRWLKGFVEVQAYQARMTRRLEINGAEALRFLRVLPRGPVAGACWVVPTGRGLRLSQTETKEAVRVGGVQRLRILDNLARHARVLRVYSDPSTGASAWELVADDVRFHLALSPEVFRGFSGEGQALADLATRRFTEVLPRVQASLQWETTINTDALARKFSLTRETIVAALAALGARGLVGYDLAQEAYFHRVLPFDLELVESLQPRLNDARRLIDAGGVRITSQEKETIEAYVTGSGVEHRVRLSAGGAKCTCPWYSKHQGARGPCKHVLAVQIALEDKE